MNAVGKMLVVLQLCLSLLFVCFAGATYSVQGTWRKNAEDAEDKNATLQQDLKDALAEKDESVAAAETAMKEAITERESAVTALQTAIQEKDTANGLLAEARQARDKAIAGNERSAGEANSRLAETLQLRHETAVLHEQLAEQLAEIRAKDSQLLDLGGLLNSYRQSEEQLFTKLADQTDLLRAYGIDPNEKVDAAPAGQVEKVDGYVSARRQNRSQTQEFVQITIGGDDKIEEGMILSVFRKGNFVCDIQISTVKPDTAVGIVVASTRRSNTQEGDRVTTKL